MYYWRMQPPLLRCYQVPSWQLGIESLRRIIEAVTCGRAKLWGPCVAELAGIGGRNVGDG